MPTLNELYGPGAQAELGAALDTASAQVGLSIAQILRIPFPAGCRLAVRWDDGSRLKADHYPDRVHWVRQAMRTPGGGMLSAMIQRLGPVYVARGVTRMTFSPRVDGQISPFHTAAGFTLESPTLAVLELT